MTTAVETGIAGAPPADAAPVDATAYVQSAGEGRRMLHLMVEGVHCGGCVRRIEQALLADPAVEHARVNQTTRRLVVEWLGGAAIADRLVRTVSALGYRVVPYDPAQLVSAEAATERALLRAMAVAGFAAGNIMLLSVAVWAGHFQDMGPATRNLLHWFSALIALPAILYAGRPFFDSALSALRNRRTNMDVPISLGVLLASGMSLFETARGGAHVYFDSAIMLLFFLLVGRYLDRRARGHARAAAERLLALGTRAVTVLEADGRRRAVPAAMVAPGDDRARRRRRADRGRRHGAGWHIRARHQPDHRRDGAGHGRPGRSGVRWHLEPRRAAAARGRRGRGSHAARRDRAADGARGAAARPVRGAGRSPRRPVRPRGARPGVCDVPGVDPARGHGLAGRAALRGGGADHHLPLRARARRAGGAGDRIGSSAEPGRAAEVGDGAGASRPGRYRGVRQDRHADPRATRAGALGADRSRGAARGCLARRLEPSPARARGRGRRAGGSGSARRRGGAGPRPAPCHPVGRGAAGQPRLVRHRRPRQRRAMRRSSGWRGRGARPCALPSTIRCAPMPLR